MDCILEHSRDDTAVEKADKYTITKGGSKRLRKTTIGWKMLVRCTDDSEEWIPLKKLKEHYPVQTAEYAVANNIADEATFAWWVPYTLRRRGRIIASVKARIRNTTVKFGIKVPRTTKQARELDRENGNTLWSDAIALEMNTILPAFDLSENDVIPPKYEKASGHIIFDVRMTLECKACWVLQECTNCFNICSTQWTSSLWC